MKKIFKEKRKKRKEKKKITNRVITESNSSGCRGIVAAHSQRCESSTAMGVEWKSAVHGGFDEQKCPDSMAGESLFTHLSDSFFLFFKF